MFGGNKFQKVLVYRISEGKNNFFLYFIFYLIITNIFISGCLEKYIQFWNLKTSNKTRLILKILTNTKYIYYTTQNELKNVNQEYKFKQRKEL